jgi:hypothetical protein
LILNMMQSCASAAKLRAAGPFSLVGISAMLEYGFPPPQRAPERFIVAIETSSNGRPLHVGLLVVRGFRTSQP